MIILTTRIINTAVERQNLLCMYLAYHSPEDVQILVIIIVTVILVVLFDFLCSTTKLGTPLNQGHGSG